MLLNEMERVNLPSMARATMGQSPANTSLSKSIVHSRERPHTEVSAPTERRLKERSVEPLNLQHCFIIS